MRFPVLASMRALAMAAALIVSTSVIAAETATYRDPTYGFAVTYPGDFVVRRQDVAALSSTPRPLASIMFMNPVMAGGALAGREPPDLEVRVYDAAAATSLSSWLQGARFASAEVLAAATPRPINGHDGLRVCRQDLVAPGCAIFVFQGGRVYQLTAISAEGEKIIDSFALPSP
ncbi:MAG: hypothetical protein U1E42_04350 [Rhodospirillales bacterium]